MRSQSVTVPITAALCLFAAVAFAVPQRVTLRYDVSRNGMAMVEATEILEHDGRSYRIQAEWQGKGVFALSARGSAKRSSRGVIDAQGLSPLEFRDQRGNDPVGVARFDWGKKILIRERDGRIETESLPARAQDRLSFAYGFVFSPPAGAEISVVIADARGLSRHRYVVAGRETLKTGAGEFEALKLVKQRDAGDDRGTEIWLATQRDYLPLRVLVIEKDGTRLDQVVTRIES